LARSRKALAEYIKTAVPLPTTQRHNHGRFLPCHTNKRDRIMTQLMPPPAPSEVEAFIGQVVTDLSAAFSGVLVNVGRKLGLYQAMADLGAGTSVALAA